MGQKTNPISLRLGVNNTTWDSLWYATDKDYADKLHEDLKIRKYIELNIKADISKVIIERLANNVRINVHSAKPGTIIGAKGSAIEKFRLELTKITKKDTHLNIVEIKTPETEPVIIADNIAKQLEKRMPFRRAMQRAAQMAMKSGALGIRINCSGKLGGAEIARMEWCREGKVPLHTLKAHVAYGIANAHTTYGVIGIKVWVYKPSSIERSFNTTELKNNNQLKIN